MWLLIFTAPSIIMLEIMKKPGDSLEYKYCINIVRFVWLVSCSAQWKLNVGDEWIQLHVFRMKKIVQKARKKVVYFKKVLVLKWA